MTATGAHGASEVRGTNPLREFFRVGPGHKDHYAASRCAISVGVPLLALLALGRTDLAIFASFGAFTAIYGRGVAHRVRLAQQSRAGGLMLLSILAGIVTSLVHSSPWVIVVGTVIVAGLGTLLAGLAALRPTGSLFQIFGFAAIASLPAQPPLWQSMLVAVLAAVFSLLVGQSTMLLPKWRTPWEKPRRVRLTVGQRQFLYADVFRYSLAVALAGSLVTLLGIGHNYWAMVAATVPLVGQTVTHRMTRGVHRILGTLGGLVVTILILLLQPDQLILVLLVVVLQFGAEMFVARHYSLAQLFITPLALLMTQLAHRSDPSMLISDRATETVIGAVAGMLVVVLVRKRHTRS